MKRHTVLVVDDDLVFLEALQAVLRTHFDVLTAADGEEAVVAMGETRPDLILLDIMMTYPSEGYDLASNLKKNPNTSDIPIVMLTGVDKMFEIRSKMEKSWVEVDGFVAKPPDFAALIELMTNLITKRAATR
jgi:two-component system sensor histidine kinase/response regulator